MNAAPISFSAGSLVTATCRRGHVAIFKVDATHYEVHLRLLLRGNRREVNLCSTQFDGKRAEVDAIETYASAVAALSRPDPIVKFEDLDIHAQFHVANTVAQIAFYGDEPCLDDVVEIVKRRCLYLTAEEARAVADDVIARRRLLAGKIR